MPGSSAEHDGGEPPSVVYWVDKPFALSGIDRPGFRSLMAGFAAVQRAERPFAAAPCGKTRSQV